MFKRNPDISHFYPNTVSDIKQFQELSTAINPELDLAWDTCNKILSNNYYESADEEGLARWEKLLGIATHPEMTIADRTFIIKTIMNQRIQYTEMRLAELLHSLTSEGIEGTEVFINSILLTIDDYQLWEAGGQLISGVNYVIVESHASYKTPANEPCNTYKTSSYLLKIDVKNQRVDVWLNLRSKFQQDAIKELLERVVPLNMILKISLQYNTHAVLANYIHTELGKNNHATLREEDISSWQI